MRHRATLAYDATRYHGFQRQSNAAPTIQGELEAALERVGGQKVSVVGAGRTDAGVHATGQVIAFSLDWGHPEEALRDALNANLPDDIAVLTVSQAAEGFHPRYDALSRTYEYRCYIAPVRDPLRRWRAWYLTGTLDVAAIRAAAGNLIGEHDFSTFGVPPVGENPVRRVSEARWEADRAGAHIFTITANAFLYHMVRTIVGTLVLVGQGRMSAASFQELLAACDRSLAGPPAPPYGLTLVSVKYRE